MPCSTTQTIDDPLFSLNTIRSPAMLYRPHRDAHSTTSRGSMSTRCGLLTGPLFQLTADPLDGLFRAQLGDNLGVHFTVPEALQQHFVADG